MQKNSRIKRDLIQDSVYNTKNNIYKHINVPRET